MVAAGTLIWISCRPLIRLLFCVTCGFGITKAGVFPAVAAAGAGQIVLKITLPCLMFSKIVPAFTAQNASALGPLVVVALLYEAMGMVLAYLIKQFFWVPHRFRYGILVAGGWANVGDIPNAVIMSITGAAPFQGTTDQNLAVAYISAFILVFLVTLFPFGGHKLVAWDFVGPDIEPKEVQEAIRLKRKAYFHSVRSIIQRLVPSRINVSTDAEKAVTGGSPCAARTGYASGLDRDITDLIHGEKVMSPKPPLSPTAIGSPVPGASLPSKVAVSDMPALSRPTSSDQTVGTELPRRRLNIHRRSLVEFMKSFLTPASMAIIVSFPIALIPTLKALFVEVPGTNIPSAPDGQPPLAFLLDSTNFVGAASVPVGLICLGSSLARLPFPQRGQWKTLPLGAVIWIAIGKLLVIPILGLLICQGLTNVGFISKEDKVLRLVCIVLSCLPTSTVHVLLTQVYSGTGTAEHLAIFLIPQYMLMFVTMTALIAFTIQLLF